MAKGAKGAEGGNEGKEGGDVDALKGDVAQELKQLGLAAGAADHEFSDFAPPAPAPGTQAAKPRKEQQVKRRDPDKGGQQQQNSAAAEEVEKRDWNAGAGPRPGVFVKVCVLLLLFDYACSRQPAAEL